MHMYTSLPSILGQQIQPGKPDQSGNPGLPVVPVMLRHEHQ